MSALSLDAVKERLARDGYTPQDTAVIAALVAEVEALRQDRDEYRDAAYALADDVTTLRREAAGLRADAARLCLENAALVRHADALGQVGLKLEAEVEALRTPQGAGPR